MGGSPTSSGDSQLFFSGSGFWRQYLWSREPSSIEGPTGKAAICGAVAQAHAFWRIRGIAYHGASSGGAWVPGGSLLHFWHASHCAQMSSTSTISGCAGRSLAFPPFFVLAPAFLALLILLPLWNALLWGMHDALARAAPGVHHGAGMARWLQEPLHTPFTPMARPAGAPLRLEP